MCLKMDYIMWMFMQYVMKDEYPVAFDKLERTGKIFESGTMVYIWQLRRHKSGGFIQGAQIKYFAPWRQLNDTIGRQELVK